MVGGRSLADGVGGSLISGREHYDRVITAVLGAELSVWIATANLKSLMVEDVGRGSRRRGARASTHRSIVSVFDELAERGVELRMLHAQAPSSPFRAELARFPRLAGRLQLRLCPRNHMKVVIVDGRLLYLGSANWTGAGLGVRGDARRNFELGLLTEDEAMLDQVQALYDRLWRGGECGGCGLRKVCAAPLDELSTR